MNVGHNVGKEEHTKNKTDNSETSAAQTTLNLSTEPNSAQQIVPYSPEEYTYYANKVMLPLNILNVIKSYSGDKGIIFFPDKHTLFCYYAGSLFYKNICGKHPFRYVNAFKQYHITKISKSINDSYRIQAIKMFAEQNDSHKKPKEMLQESNVPFDEIKKITLPGKSEKEKTTFSISNKPRDRFYIQNGIVYGANQVCKFTYPNHENDHPVKVVWNSDTVFVITTQGNLEIKPAKNNNSKKIILPDINVLDVAVCKEPIIEQGILKKPQRIIIYKAQNKNREETKLAFLGDDHTKYKDIKEKIPEPLLVACADNKIKYFTPTKYLYRCIQLLSHIELNYYMSHTVVLSETGDIWVKGYNYSGQLGTGDYKNRLNWTKLKDKLPDCFLNEAKDRLNDRFFQDNGKLKPGAIELKCIEGQTYIHIKDENGDIKVYGTGLYVKPSAIRKLLTSKIFLSKDRTSTIIGCGAIITGLATGLALIVLVATSSLMNTLVGPLLIFLVIPIVVDFIFSIICRLLIHEMQAYRDNQPRSNRFAEQQLETTPENFKKYNTGFMIGAGVSVVGGLSSGICFFFQHSSSALATKISGTIVLKIHLLTLASSIALGVLGVGLAILIICSMVRVFQYYKHSKNSHAVNNSNLDTEENDDFKKVIAVNSATLEC